MFHDWADEYCLTLLKDLDSAADSKIDLVIIEQVIAAREIPGAEIPIPPLPLLRNLSLACSQEYLADMVVRKLI